MAVSPGDMLVRDGGPGRAVLWGVTQLVIGPARPPPLEDDQVGVDRKRRDEPLRGGHTAVGRRTPITGRRDAKGCAEALEDVVEELVVAVQVLYHVHATRRQEIAIKGCFERCALHLGEVATVVDEH
eukprot:7379411-Prymnesium_polylepis.1